MDTITITLSRQDMENFVTGNGFVDVDEETIESEIDRYTSALISALGDGYEVEVSRNALETLIDGYPAHYADDDIRQAVDDAEASICDTFWD